METTTSLPCRYTNTHTYCCTPHWCLCHTLTTPKSLWFNLNHLSIKLTLMVYFKIVFMVFFYFSVTSRFTSPHQTEAETLNLHEKPALWLRTQQVKNILATQSLKAELLCACCRTGWGGGSNEGVSIRFLTDMWRNLRFSALCHICTSASLTNNSSCF